MNKKRWSARIRPVTPYVPGEQPKDRTYIKLNTNENPYPPSEKVSEVLHSFEAGTLRLYPDPSALSLRSRLAALHPGLTAENVFVGNGSDELLAFAFLAFTDGETKAVFPDITYSFYPVFASFFGCGSRIVPLAEDFTVPLSEMEKNDGTVFLPNPNAPTGIAIPLEDVAALARANPDHVVIIDEAYVDFGAHSAAEMVNTFDNLLVIQTFSKSRSLAGLRVGFAYGCPDIIAALDTVKNSFNSYTLDRVALAAAEASLMDLETFHENCSAIIKTRQRTAARLTEMGFTVLPSCSNFLFAAPPGGNASELFHALREKGILVRYFPGPRTGSFLRISVGTDSNMDALLRAIAQFQKEGA